jgi:hypothetical protein
MARNAFDQVDPSISHWYRTNSPLTANMSSLLRFRRPTNTKSDHLITIFRLLATNVLHCCLMSNKWRKCMVLIEWNGLSSSFPATTFLHWPFLSLSADCFPEWSMYLLPFSRFSYETICITWCPTCKFCSTMKRRPATGEGHNAPDHFTGFVRALFHSALFPLSFSRNLLLQSQRSIKMRWNEMCVLKSL